MVPPSSTGSAVSRTLTARSTLNGTSGAHWENPEVLPLVSVAVAVMNPPACAPSRIVKAALPPPSVVTFVVPSHVRPSP